jgi:peroxiredoxin
MESSKRTPAVLASTPNLIALALLLLAFSLPVMAQEDYSGFSWKDLNGQSHTLADYKGKVVVLNFWATWCVPCQHEMPMFADVQKHYAEKGVQLLGASVDDDKSQPKIGPFAQKNKIPFPLLIAANTDQMQKLGLGEAIPATVFIDQDGKISARVLGELDKGDLKHRLDWMLGEHKGNEPQAFVDGFKKKKGGNGSISPPKF